MPITVNEGGVLHELETVTSNEGGVLYELDTVHANEGGVLYEIFSANTLPTELKWSVRTSGSFVDSAASLVSYSGLSVVFKGASATSIAVQCYQIRLRAGTVIRHKFTAVSDFTYTSLIANLWVCKVGSTLTSGSNMFTSNSYTVPEDGYYYIGLGGMAWNGPASTANWATFTSTISFSK